MGYRALPARRLSMAQMMRHVCQKGDIMADNKTHIHREVKDESDEEHQRDPNSHVDPKYLRHHDAARIEARVSPTRRPLV